VTDRTGESLADATAENWGAIPHSFAQK